MAVPVQRTWVTGEIVTAAYMNANVRDAVNFLLEPPTARAWHTGAASLTSGVTYAAVPLGSEDYDTDSIHSTSTTTERMTAVTAGRYLIKGQAGFSNNSTGSRAVAIRKNGTVLEQVVTAAASSASHFGQVTARVNLAAGDYVDMAVWQNSGSTINLVNGNDSTFLECVWMRAT